MLWNMLNDLAEAIWRWTEKNLNLKSPGSNGARAPRGCTPAPIFCSWSYIAPIVEVLCLAAATALGKPTPAVCKVVVGIQFQGLLKFKPCPIGGGECEGHRTLSVNFQLQHSWEKLCSFCSGRSEKGSVSHIKDLFGFSHITGMPLWTQSLMTFMENLYNLFAVITLSFATPCRWGRPFGQRSDLRGTGCMPFLGRGISLALLEVPQGGANITASTFPSCIQHSTVLCPSWCARSTFATGPFTLLLSTMWSMPNASPPIALKAAATPAVPQNKSSKNKDLFRMCFHRRSVTIHI